MSLGNNSTIQTSMGDNHYVISLLNSGYRWASDTVHYSYEGFTSSERASIHRAMLAWGSVTNLDFNHTTGKKSEILFQAAPENLLAHYGYSGTPYEATDRPGPDSDGSEYETFKSNDGTVNTRYTVTNLGRVHTHFATDCAPFVQGVKAGEAGFEVMMHEIGHALGLKHTFDAGANDNNTNIFYNATKHGYGDYRLNQAVYSVMSYNTHYDPGAPKDLDYQGYMKGPMAFDIAAIQQLYGARQHVNDNDSYYELFDSTASSSHMGWTSLWDTGGTDTIAYNGSFNAVIDLRPATLDRSATGGGMMSYTWRLGAGGRHIMTSQGYTIAGDISNAIADDNGVTGVLIEKAVGGDGTDRLTGNDAGNQLWGYDGVDTLIGGGGNDTLIGGAGADIVKGGSGDDTYRVDDVGDYVTEMNSRHVDSGGVDLVRTKLSEYTLGNSVRSQIENLSFFGSGSFTGTGNSLNNTIIGGAGLDILIGGDGNDRLDGRGNSDSMAGGAGDDTYVVDGGEDIVNENNGEGDAGGNDTIETGLGFYALTDSPNSKIENLTLLSKNGAGGVGNELDNTLTGNTGDDFLQGNGGSDTLIGMGGHDSLVGGAGDDTYVVNGADAVIVEDADGGVDTVETHLATYTLHDNNVENLTFEDYYYHRRFTGNGNALDNAIRGGSRADQLSGNDGDDYLYGNGGEDSLQGGAGNDTLRGGIGNDDLRGGAGSDTADYHDTANRTDINLSLGIARVLKSDAELDTLVSIENIIGSKGADKVVGDDQDNSFIYQGWYGRLSSSGGADTFDGAGGSDTIDFADFRVQMMTIDLTEGTAIGKYSVDSGSGIKNGSKTVVSFSHVENVVSSRGDDTIIGDDNDNTFIDAGAYRYQHEVGGIDHCFGGGGNDTVDFSRYDGTLDIDLERGDAQASYNVSVQGGGEAGATIAAYLTGIENVTGSLDSDTVKGDDNDNTFSYIGSFTANSAAGGFDNYDGRAGSNTVDMSKFRGKADIDLTAGTVSSSYHYDNGEGGGTASTQIVAMTNVQNAVGSGFADTIEGSAEANKISGGGGSDRIIGNGGDDRLTGGGGSDTFVFDSTSSGNDVITDFAPATNRRGLHDVIEFSTSVFIDWDHLLAATSDSEDGAFIRLDDNNNGITLTGVTKQSLINHHESDFAFV